MPTELDGRQIKDNSIPASKIIGGVGGSLSYSAISSSTSISSGSFYAVDASIGNIVLTLSDGVTAGDSLSIKKTDSSGYTVTINNANIDGETAIIMSVEDECIDLYWTGTQFLIN